MSHILTIKSSADSLKYQLFNENNEELVSGYISEAIDYQQAIKQVLRNIKDFHKVAAVGHYIAYGQEEFIKPVIVDENILTKIEEQSLNQDEIDEKNKKEFESNLINVASIRACLEYLDLPQIAVFDTAFFDSLPEVSRMCLDRDEIPIHGLAHQGAMQFIAAKNKQKLSEVNIISCYLENFGSVAAIKKGKPADISPSFFLISDNKDYKYFLKEATFSPEARLTLDAFTFKIRKYIGSALAVIQDEIDAIVLSGEVFIRQPAIKQKITQGLDFFGKKVKVLVAESQEGLMIAKEVKKVLNAK